MNAIHLRKIYSWYTRMKKKNFFLFHHRPGRPTHYDKQNCESTLNKRTCQYEVVKKSNRRVKCQVFGAVGR